ncbi:MAG: hypothetical protein A2Z14_00010 [Chloroflexi bacterium RBG_16_48_8]|nr:MAG: hypothetical protein A2Z14_00010 [Chloroflexi bacterium RBG_16_48_8]
MSTIRTIARGVLFWLLWVFATLAGLLVYWALLQASGVEAQLVSLLESWIGIEGTNLRVFEFATNGLLGLIEGLTIGLFQWFALRRRIKRALAWIPATGLGFALGLVAFWASFVFITGDQLPQGNPTEWAFEVGLLRSSLIGLFLGLAQWLVLFRQFRGHAWWVPTILLAVIGSWFSQWFLSKGLAFIILGAVTGIPLALMLLSRERARIALEKEASIPEKREDPLKRLDQWIS